MRVCLRNEGSYIAAQTRLGRGENSAIGTESKGENSRGEIAKKITRSIDPCHL